MVIPAQDLNGTAVFPTAGSFDFTLTDEGNPGQNTGSGKAGPTGGPSFTVSWERTFVGTTEYLIISRDGAVLAILEKPSGPLNPDNAWLNNGGAGEIGNW